MLRCTLRVAKVSHVKVDVVFDVTNTYPLHSSYHTYRHIGSSQEMDTTAKSECHFSEVSLVPENGEGM